MPEENVEIVRTVIDAYNRRRWDLVLRDMAPVFELDLSRAVGPNRGVYGLEQVRGVLEEFADQWASVRIEPDEFIEAGDDVIVPWTFHGTGREGIEVKARSTWAFTIHDGAIQRASMYQERQEALAAAGLSNQPKDR